MTESTHLANIAAVPDHFQNYISAPMDANNILLKVLPEYEAAPIDSQPHLDASDELAPGFSKPHVQMLAAYSQDMQLAERSYACWHCGNTRRMLVRPSALLPSACDKPLCQKREAERRRCATAAHQKTYRERHNGMHHNKLKDNIPLQPSQKSDKANMPDTQPIADSLLQECHTNARSLFGVFYVDRDGTVNDQICGLWWGTRQEAERSMRDKAERYSRDSYHTVTLLSEFEHLTRLAEQAACRVKFKTSAEMQIEDYPGWLAEHNLIDGIVAREQVGLCEAQWLVAHKLGLLPCAHIMDGPLVLFGYPATIALTAERRAELNDKFTLTARQAAEQLNISMAQFKKLRKAAGIEPSDWCIAKSQPGKICLYRLSDVQRLQNIAERLRMGKEPL